MKKRLSATEFETMEGPRRRPRSTKRAGFKELVNLYEESVTEIRS